MSLFPDKIDDWKTISALINKSEKIFISTHINPDGDAIGSEMAFAGFLNHLRKPFRIINSSKTPGMYAFLDPDNIIETPVDNILLGDGPKNTDLIIFLDLGNYNRVGIVLDFLVGNGSKKVVIDHHIPEPVEADVVVVDTDASSTGSLIYDLFCVIDSSLIDKEIAKAILTTIVTDTGFFRYSNTTSGTLRLAALLYDLGTSARDIRRQLEIGEPLCRQKLLGLTLSHVQLASCGRIAYSYITSPMFEETGASREHTEDIINHIRIIKGIKIAVLFVQEKEREFKVSFRATGKVAVNIVAAELGGGGHEKAAGANMSGTLEEVIERVLKVTSSILDREER